MSSGILLLPWYVSGFIIVSIFITFALLTLYLTRKFVSTKHLRENHDIAGYTFGIIGVIYAVLLGFVAVNVNEDYHDAEKIAEKEAIVLIDLFRDAEIFTQEIQENIHKAIIDYTKYVISSEWQTLSESNGAKHSKAPMHNLWKAFISIEPQTEAEKIWLQESVRKLNEFSNIRLERIYNSKGSIGAMMWTFLLAGAITVTIFMCFFYSENIYSQNLMTAFLAGTIAFMLFLIFSLDNIYYGDLSVKPIYLQRALQFFEGHPDL